MLARSPCGARRFAWLPAAFATLILALPLALPSAAKAQTRILVPYPPGGATDMLARTLAPRLGAVLGQNFIVENRAGASGQIGTAALKGAPADGSVYLFSTEHTVVTVPFLFPKAGYDALKDFMAVGQVARFQLGMTVSPGTGAKSLSEFADFARANPAKANYGVPVIGGFPSTVGVAVSKKVGTPMTAVPYNGSGPVVQAVAADQVSSGITGLADTMPMVQAGRVRVVAVTGTKRSSVLPDVPTFEELGYPGMNVYGWYAFFAPKGLPPPVAEKFNKALATVLAEPEIRQRIRDLTTELAPTTLDEADRELRTSYDFWTRAANSPDFVRP